MEAHGGHGGGSGMCSSGWLGLVLPLLDLGSSRSMQWGHVLLFDKVLQREMLVWFELQDVCTCV